MARLGRTQPVRAVVVRSRRYPTVWIQGLAAALTFSGAIKRLSLRIIAAALSFAGALKRRTGRILVATITPAGALLKKTNTVRAATLSFTGTTRKLVSKAVLAAALSFTGSLTKLKLALKALAASLDFSGALTKFKFSIKALAATLDFTGVLARSKVSFKSLVATLSFIANVKQRAAFPLQFPIAGIYDNFNRANSASIGSQWQIEEPALEIVDNMLAATSNGARIRTTQTFNNDQEAYVKVVQKANSIGAKVRVYTRIGA